jgi:hypothetical protein
MDDALEGPQGREMVFRFVGGPVDGSELSSCVRAETSLLWVLTRCGTVGQEYWLVTPKPQMRPLKPWYASCAEAYRRHRYRVINRQDSDGRIAVTSVFVCTGL